MRRTMRGGVVVATLVMALASGARGENWPGWRGPRGDGTSAETGTPTKWNGKTGENIAWKTRIEGVGHSSPVIWNDHVFVSTCLTETRQRALLAIDRRSGKILWQQIVIEAPLEKKHSLNSYASGTPVTDGTLVYVSYLEPDFGSDKERTPGNMVVAAYDFQGQRRWQVKPGRFASVHGFCSSPVIFEDLLIVNADHDGDSYIVALDRQTGQQRWKVNRDHKTRSYVTPLIREINGRTQMVLSGSKSVVSYDPRTGEKHWWMQGPTEQFVASMVYDGTYLFLTAGFPDYHILAIKPDGKGDVTDTHIAWRTTKPKAYVPSPIVVDGYFLVVADAGIAGCFDAKTGDQLWNERLGKHYSASLIASSGLVYFLADDGIAKVVRPGKTLDVVAENDLGEYCYASPAISQGQLFVRGEQHLYCIGSKP